jgi:hypothetical protein
LELSYLTDRHPFDSLSITHVQPCEDSKGRHLLAHGRTDPVEHDDWKLLDKRWPHLRRDDVLPVRLTVIGGKMIAL